MGKNLRIVAVAVLGTVVVVGVQLAAGSAHQQPVAQKVERPAVPATYDWPAIHAEQKDFGMPVTDERTTSFFLGAPSTTPLNMCASVGQPVEASDAFAPLVPGSPAYDLTGGVKWRVVCVDAHGEPDLVVTSYGRYLWAKGNAGWLPGEGVTSVTGH